MVSIDKINHKQRRLEILRHAAGPYGLLCNAKWGGAFTKEYDMKWLVSRGMVRFSRVRHSGFFARPYTAWTRAYITDRGKEYLEKHDRKRNS